MSNKTYTAPKQACCIAALENCTTCSEKDRCFVLKEQLAFYNRLGISQIDDDIDSEALMDIRPLLETSNRNKKYDPSWNYAEDNTRAYTHSIHPYGIF
jgi:hypothetical protein